MAHVLTVETSAELADDLAARLLDAGAEGAEVRDGTVLPMPGAKAPSPGAALVLAWFHDGDDAHAAAAALGVAGAVEVAPDEDWSERWKRDLGAFTVGRVFIRPSWVDGAAPPGAVELVLDPGMAFGTGTHATTALCLAAVDRHLAQYPDDAVLDVGTGSGLLAIAAAKLGAPRVVGTENDPVALAVARENAGRNGVAPELLLEPPARVEGRFELVVANILANTLVELAPELAAKVAPGGVLLLSGLLGGQEDDVRGAYERAGLVAARDLDGARDEWRLVALRAAGENRPPGEPRDAAPPSTPRLRRYAQDERISRPDAGVRPSTPRLRRYAQDERISRPDPRVPPTPAAGEEA